MEQSKPGKSVYLRIGVWYDEKTGSIHLACRDVKGFHTTVKADPESVRGHPNLFKKLSKALQDAGAPHPSIEDDE